MAGPDYCNKADKLAEKLKTVLAGEATIVRPMKMGKLLIRGIDESITVEELTDNISAIGTYSREHIKYGTLRVMRNGLGMVWACCPLEAAIKIAENGSIRIGWTNIRVDLLQARKLQCFRCLEFGHVKATCKNEIDRSSTCYRCGISGHLAKDCKDPPSCVLCREK